MNKDYLVRTIEMDCPLCNKIHAIEERKGTTQAIIKNEVVDYEQVYYCCALSDEEENDFVPGGIMDENLLRARNAYRVKKGLLTSDDIAKIRSFYGLTQSDFAALLGWGDVTVTRYESKFIQDETYDNIMRMVYNNPMFALGCLERHKERFNPEKYAKIRKSIKERVVELGNLYLKRQEIESLYVNFEEETDYNGYKVLDIEKLSNVIGYFAQFMDHLYKVKLMKLLWYTDTIFFGRYGKSMTGLVYKHKPLGALPIAYDEIIHLPTVKVVEDIINEDICYKICPNKEVSISEFTLKELSVLELVATKFKNHRSKEIVDYMHMEKAYKETQQNQIIPYTLAKRLRELK
ncbi:type II TA system antitoxin MqsA family protein [Desulfosporosinus metallidurans]|uniref:Prophage ps3 protein 01 n=1 Tax=Desulfosporosinus metallidurans TaxID=1888891 RepID=A0A1Q8QYM8_9FIRM|nr:type II TA system antitoxin MqsA family protein [Desulfosporosinus metallidurans]OLN32462.1 Prophage ps3 protein 01 [Desulfosporosinus metallidurans]